MSKLTLHCGANEVSLNDVESVWTPPASDSHFPIPHATLLQEARTTLTDYGFDILGETHALGGQAGSRYFGLLEVVHNDLSVNRTWNGVVGVRNSHDKVFAAGLTSGSRVFVCDNLAFSGTVTLSRKHTRFIMRDLPRMMLRAVSRIRDAFIEQERDYNTYAETFLSDTQARWLMVEMVRRGVIGCTHLPSVLDQWEKPAHEDFEPRNLWSLFNAVTEVAKGWSPETSLRRTQYLHTLCNAAADGKWAIAV